MSRFSILQDASVPKCLVTGATSGLHWHHIYKGVALRPISEREGFTCYLRADIHRMLHERIKPFDQLDFELMRACQEAYEGMGHAREEFRAIVGKSYLGNEKEPLF